MIKSIIIPRYVRQGIKKNHLSFPKQMRFWGCDTETCSGDPHTLQFSQDGKSADLIYVDRDTVLDKFFEYIEPRLLYANPNIIYFHQLEFDLAVLLCKYHHLWLSSKKIELKYKNWQITAVISSVCFCFMKNLKNNKQLKLLDSRAFFTDCGKTGLKALMEQLKLPVQKLEYQEKWSKQRVNTPEFETYAKQDAICEWHLADWILKQHENYGLRVSVSSSQFSARIFRHYFLEPDDLIPFPPGNMLKPALLSYHGGKNGFYCQGVTVVDKCYEADVISMYPYAMTQIPNFIAGRYVFQSEYTDEYEGVWCISGKVSDCKYSCLFAHDFTPLRDEIIENIWVTSYELREALNTKEFLMTDCWGYVWIPDRVARNPFKDFVMHFFNKKNTTDKHKFPSEYLLYKICMNSLYGKLIQTVEDETPDRETPDYIIDERSDDIVKNKRKQYWFKAGGLFNPFIATLITGFARVKLHQLEHQYKALHSSTDSIKTVIKPKPSAGLGGLSIETTGRCILLRNKLYLHYDESGKLTKYALHGFQGRPDLLLKMFEKKKTKYTINRMFRVREAFRQKKKALDFCEVDRKLDIDFSKIYYIKGVEGK